MAFLNIEKTDQRHEEKTNNKENNLTNEEVIKNEVSLGICIGATIGEIMIVLVIIYLLILVALNVFHFKVNIFPLLEEYSLKEYNMAIRRCFVMLSGFLIAICLVLKFVINNAIKTRFVKKYLKKLNVYLYDVFILVINTGLYIFIAWIFFKIVNDIHADILLMNFIENVNVDTINIFKYVIVVIIAIFGVLNSFAGIGINHQRNKFVLEDYF